MSAAQLEQLKRQNEVLQQDLKRERIKTSVACQE